MPKVTIILGEENRILEVPAGSILGEVIATTDLPLEQPCAGRGTCGRCKVLVQSGVAHPDEIERKHLSAGELAINNRLACRARVENDTKVILSPVVVYSNKIFTTNHRYQQTDAPLGLAIDLGTTTVAAFLTILDSGEVCAGGASLNQQSVFGADVISRLASVVSNPQNAEHLHRLALASIIHAVDSLKIAPKYRQRIERVTIVGNVAMHHLLAKFPIHTLVSKPFQPYHKESIVDASPIVGHIFPKGAKVSLPPLIGGFVGSDALACLGYFGFDHVTEPMAAIDLGTNGEVLVTDGKRILVASTAAGPAFEGVLISCGSRAVDGAITTVHLENGELELETIAGKEPVGLTGSGLISLVHVLRKAGVIEPNGRIVKTEHALLGRVETNSEGTRVRVTEDGRLGLSQKDIRELQKAKAAIAAAFETLMEQLGLNSQDLEKIILTGSFGGQIDVAAALELGLLPPVPPEKVKNVPNGAGFGAALFLSDQGFALGEKLARKAVQVDLDRDSGFFSRFINAMVLAPNDEKPS